MDHSEFNRTDEEIRAAYRRIRRVLLRDEPENRDDYHRTVLVVSDLSSEPYDRVHRVCIEED